MFLRVGNKNQIKPGGGGGWNCRGRSRESSTTTTTCVKLEFCENRNEEEEGIEGGERDWHKIWRGAD